MDWSSIPQGPEDAVCRVSRLYAECTIPDKVSLGVGAYRDEQGQPLVLDAVVRAKERLASLPSQEWTHEYQPIVGHAGFLEAAQHLAFGKFLKNVTLVNRVVSLQSISGTGAVRLACELVAHFGTSKVLLLPTPTWANHSNIGRHAGLEIRHYRYLDADHPTTPQLDFEGLLEDLREAPEGATVLLNACAQNPTGMDPTSTQWEEIASVCAERQLQPLFDNAYQSFASGDLDQDAASMRTFVKMGLCPLVACSFAENMGLYGEWIGALHVVTPDAQAAQATLSQLINLVRSMYASPPQFGAMVAHLVLTDDELRTSWVNQLKTMLQRIRTIRETLRTKLEEMVPDQSWSHIIEQIGAFSYTGLTPNQVRHCAKQGGVFMLSSGRINVAGLNESNVDYVAKAMAAAIRAHPS